jgi:DNA gyrase inhibitor GyrI
MSSSAATPVERPEIEVLFLRTEDDPAAIGRGFERLETTVDLRGRKFFGAFFPATCEYWACVQSREGDDPAALGLESGRLPGGRYLRTRLRGEPPQLDESRPSIEFYRRHDEIDLLRDAGENLV